MSIVIKTIKNKRYAYTARREGAKVVQKYLGPLSNPEVVAQVENSKKEKQVPPQYQALFWDVDIDQINLKASARYIIERVLEFGGLDAFYWIQNIYQTKLIIETLIASRKISEKSKNFWLIWLGANKESFADVS